MSRAAQEPSDQNVVNDVRLRVSEFGLQVKPVLERRIPSSLVNIQIVFQYRNVKIESQERVQFAKPKACGVAKPSEKVHQRPLSSTMAMHPHTSRKLSS